MNKQELIEEFRKEVTRKAPKEIRKWPSERTFKLNFGPTAIEAFISKAYDAGYEEGQEKIKELENLILELGEQD